jgi:hypothetical protein
MASDLSCQADLTRVSFELSFFRTHSASVEREARNHAVRREPRNSTRENKMKSTIKELVVVAGTVAVGVCSIALGWGQTPRSAKEMQGSANSQAAAKLQSLNIKPGLWESTRTIKRTGALPIPAEMLNRLTPEQRARMEERMKANSAAHTNTTTEKHCVTKEDLEKDRMKLAETNECTTTVLSSSSTSVKAKLVCDQEGMHATGTLDLVAADPEHMNGSYHSTANADGHTMDVEGTWTSKWLGSSCGNVR